MEHPLDFVEAFWSLTASGKCFLVSLFLNPCLSKLGRLILHSKNGNFCVFYLFLELFFFYFELPVFRGITQHSTGTNVKLPHIFFIFLECPSSHPWPVFPTYLANLSSNAAMFALPHLDLQVAASVLQKLYLKLKKLVKQM